MNLLFVGTSPRVGGAETHFVALARAMSRSGHHVVALVHPQGWIRQNLADGEIEVRTARLRNVVDLRGYVGILRAARHCRADLIVGDFGKEYWPLLILGRLLRIPVALFRHRIPPMHRLSGYLVPRLADHFVAVSNYARRIYIEQGAPAERVDVLYNPIDTAAHRPDPRRRAALLQQLGLAAEDIVLGYVGRIHGGKGVFTLFEAACQAMRTEPRLHCVWLGDGLGMAELRERLRALDPALARRHRLTGWIDDASPYYNVFSILALPSTMPEAFGRVLVEAQASGTPVLGSAIGGIPETLEPGVTGLLLPPGDIAAWREGILTLCDTDCRQRLAENGREFVAQRFSEQAVAAAFLRLVKQPPTSASPHEAWRTSGIHRRHH
ncbi:glycosyltransferase family 4 protein [Dyella sp. A6]|uniref:glycosyltransferase family 4 protein n=1 Tax=Dyella aluminiiresistens TaxID=3069105 RepID=UPI002E7604AF|nr:glycosyltransferase family 4 protein [Dyella sp. A6]